MKYTTGQRVRFKTHEGKIIFLYPQYKRGRNAYTVELLKSGLHRLCYEDELSLPAQVSIFEILADEKYCFA